MSVHLFSLINQFYHFLYGEYFTVKPRASETHVANNSKRFPWNRHNKFDAASNGYSDVIDQ